MRLSTSWKNYIQSCIDNETFDKHHKLILSLTMASNPTKDCIRNFKYNASLCFIEVAPITKEILLCHHFTEIGR